ncbi:hypothetical protein [Nonomuraea basaltis]|uniref:hypothetical protein n=1 Tax=Nonomuraea basaltis TaxID=2495887 RepID=UPI00110C6BED|nr:hypothetical protein [Nonomuraea basaltis]TMR99580.1 hypothetical protein EJK15_07135 [Nonomuraea basaltis]
MNRPPYERGQLVWICYGTTANVWPLLRALVTVHDVKPYKHDAFPAVAWQVTILNPPDREGPVVYPVDDDGTCADADGPLAPNGRPWIVADS